MSELHIYISTEDRKQFLYHFSQLNPIFLTDNIANQVFSS
jgi:hypothetical protein